MSARAPRIARCLNPLQLWRLWVGRDPLRAMLHIEQGLASALYVQTGLLGALLTAAMGAPAWASAGLLLASWLCALGFGWAVRSGWSQRFAWSCTPLSAQAALMLLVGALHYLLLDRYRALVIGPVVLLLAFCMFRLERRSILRLVALQRGLLPAGLRHRLVRVAAALRRPQRAAAPGHAAAVHPGHRSCGLPPAPK